MSTKKEVKKIKEEFDVLDVRGRAASNMSSLKELFNHLSKEPTAKQIAVGGLSGWVVGFLSMKVGKFAAMVCGASLIGLQLAAYKGYIKVDWNRVNKDIEKSSKILQKEVQSSLNSSTSDKAMRFARENVVLASSFGGGVLVGIATA